MSFSCAADDGPRAVVTLSLGNRPFVQHTRPLMAAYARRVHADFHCVDSTSHESVKSAAIAKAKNAAATRFLKLPLLTHFLKLYARVLYLDDDVLIGPAMPDLFARVPCTHVGATVEKHKPQNWHTMHWRSACELYGIENCQARQWQLFNSGLMVLSRRAHGQVLATGWRDDAPRLTCRILCDQLYLNALLLQRAARPLFDLGAAFNYVGSELRRALVTTPAAAPDAPGTDAAGAAKRRTDAAVRRAGLRDACTLHLTRKVPKLYTVDWAARRMLQPTGADVLQCGANASWPASGAEAAERRRSLRAKLPSPLPARKYDIGRVLCQGEAPSCALHPWVAQNGRIGP